MNFRFGVAQVAAARTRVFAVGALSTLAMVAARVGPLFHQRGDTSPGWGWVCLDAVAVLAVLAYIGLLWSMGLFTQYRAFQKVSQTYCYENMFGLRRLFSPEDLVRPRPPLGAPLARNLCGPRIF